MTARIHTRRAVFAATGSLAVLLVAILAAQAGAATYHHFLCKVPYGANAGGPAPADNTAYNVVGPSSSAAQGCADGLPMTAAMGGMVDHAYDQGANVTYTPPAGLAISGFKLWRNAIVGPIGGTGAPQTDIRYTGAALDQCFRPACETRGTFTPPFAAGNEVTVPGPLSGVSAIRWTANCGGSPGAVCTATGQNASAIINVMAADVLLNDPTPPAVSGVSGPLVAGGTLTGTQAISFNATDAGSGVSKGTVVVDGAVVSETPLDTSTGCKDLGVAPDNRPSYVNTQPCAPATSGLLSLDTDALTPGAHALTIRVADAAGNETVAATAAITVRGVVPVGAPNGAGASRGAKLAAVFAGRRPTTRTLSFRGRATITGRLVAESGSSITGAAIDVLARERRVGAQTAPIATATTGADGRFRLTLPAGPSRTITVQYTAFSGDATPAARVRLRALVKASVTASASTSSPRIGRLLRIRGRLRYLPRRGVDVAIQARDGRTWRTVDTVKTGAGGRYSWPYRFRNRASAGRAYFFRARVNSAIYPVSAGNSRVISVRVRR